MPRVLWETEALICVVIYLFLEKFAIFDCFGNEPSGSFLDSVNYMK